MEIRNKLLGSECCEVVLTRDGDSFLPIFERSIIANEHQADLFLSVHANAVEQNTERATGFEVYYVSDKASASAIDVISRENSEGNRILSYGSDLKQFIVELYRRGATRSSKPFANHLYRSLKKSLAKEWGIRPRGVLAGPFYVLMGAEMPAVLLEVLFVTNSKDVELLLNKKFRESVGEEVTASIVEYLNKAK